METKYRSADPIHQEFPELTSFNLERPDLQTELGSFVTQQAAEDAFMPAGKRHQQAEIVRALISEQTTDADFVSSLMKKYFKQMAEYRGEVDHGSEDTTVKVDFGKIGWLRELEKGATELAAEKVNAGNLSYDLVNLSEMDGVTSDCFENLKKQGGIDKILQRIKEDAIPKLWSDITTGRGRQRPISVGSTKDISQAAKAGRNLDTEYAGYKIDVNGTNNRAIVLVVGRNNDNQPQFALAALYDHTEQDRIWSELMTRGIGSKT